MQVVDRRVINALKQMPLDPKARFRWVFFRDMITDVSLPPKYFYIRLKSTIVIEDQVYQCIYRLIAFLILKDLTWPTYKGKSYAYDQYILGIFGEEYRDDIKECVRKYSQRHALEIEKAYREFKLNLARDLILSGWFDSLIFDPEKVEEFIEDCIAEWLTD